MFHISVINKGKDNVFGWNNKERMCFSFKMLYLCRITHSNNFSFSNYLCISVP